MKTLLPIVILFFIFSCSSNEKKSGSTSEEFVNAPTIADATLEQIAGIWEIAEIRTNPNEKGKKPGMMDKGIIFGFTKEGNMSTTSLGLEYMKETLGENSPKIKIENGKIYSGEEGIQKKIFNGQWGECLHIVLLNENEMALGYNIFGNSENFKEYKYFKKVSE